MIFNASIETDVQTAIERLNYLIKNQKVFELKEKKKRRSINQNSYMHLLFGWFGLHFGYTLEEVKQEIFKKEVNPDIFYLGEKTGIVNLSEWQSTSKLDTGEMTLAIDRFRDFSATHGLYLPEPKDLAALQQIENEINKLTSKQYL